MLAIQALCCKRQGEPLEIIDETFYSTLAVRKFEKVASFRSIEDLVGYESVLITDVALDLARAIGTDPESTILQYCNSAAGRLNCTKQMIFDVLRHLVARKTLEIPWADAKELPSNRLAELRILVR